MRGEKMRGEQTELERRARNRNAAEPAWPAAYSLTRSAARWVGVFCVRAQRKRCWVLALFSLAIGVGVHRAWAGPVRGRPTWQGEVVQRAGVGIIGRPRYVFSECPPHFTLPVRMPACSCVRGGFAAMGGQRSVFMGFPGAVRRGRMSCAALAPGVMVSCQARVAIVFWRFYPIEQQRQGFSQPVAGGDVVSPVSYEGGGRKRNSVVALSFAVALTPCATTLHRPAGQEPMNKLATSHSEDSAGLAGAGSADHDEAAAGSGGCHLSAAV
jgi:hypothetical protein